MIPPTTIGPARRLDFKVYTHYMRARIIPPPWIFCFQIVLLTPDHCLRYRLLVRLDILCLCSHQDLPSLFVHVSNQDIRTSWPNDEEARKQEQLV